MRSPGRLEKEPAALAQICDPVPLQQGVINAGETDAIPPRVGIDARTYLEVLVQSFRRCKRPTLREVSAPRRWDDGSLVHHLSRYTSYRRSAPARDFSLFLSLLLSIKLIIRLAKLRPSLVPRSSVTCPVEAVLATLRCSTSPRDHVFSMFRPNGPKRVTWRNSPLGSYR